MVASDKNNVPQVSTSRTEGNLTTNSDRVQTPVVGAGLKDFGGGQSRSYIEEVAEGRERLYLLEKEEMETVEKLGKNLSVINVIVKDARIIHKAIRDAIGEAVVYFEHLKECRETLARTRAEYNRGLEHACAELGVCSGEKSTQVQKESTRKRVGSVKEVATQTKQEVRADSRQIRRLLSTPNSDRKKRGALSSPEELSRERKRRDPRKVFVSGTREMPQPSVREAKPRESDLTEARGEPPLQAWKTAKGRKGKREARRAKSGNAPRKKLRGRLPEALMLTVTGEHSYADVLRDLKKKVDPNSHGVKVSGIRRTRAGALLVEISKGSKAEDLRQVVINALEGKAIVRTTMQNVTIEILDMDEVTDEEELRAAIIEATSDIESQLINIRWLRTVFRETKKAVVTLPVETADKLLKVGRLKVGWVRCRGRERTQVTRCFRCLGFGQVAAKCKSEDRSTTCRLCGLYDHFARDCKNPPAHCVICAEGIGVEGAQHILGSAKCTSFQRALNKAQK